MLVETGLPECSEPTRGKSKRAILDRWHIYHDKTRNTYSLAGCISNRTDRALSSSDLAAQLSYVYAENTGSLLDTLLSIQDGSYDLMFDSVPSMAARPFVVRQAIEAETVRELGGIGFGIYQVDWQGRTEARSRDLSFTTVLSGFTPPPPGNFCDNLLGMTGDVVVGDLNIRRDAFGVLNVEGCLRNGTNSTVGQVQLKYIDASESAESDVTFQTLHLRMERSLDSGEVVYFREPISEEDTDIILRAIDWRDFDRRDNRTTIVTQSITMQS